MRLISMFQTAVESGGAGSSLVSMEAFMAGIYVFVLAAFLGYQLISRVPPLLHTPLMSATNAISAISVVGALVMAGANYDSISDDQRSRRVPDH
jgi:NAD/NADP transhydrogenase alpha subunit